MLGALAIFIVGCVCGYFAQKHSSDLEPLTPVEYRTVVELVLVRCSNVAPSFLFKLNRWMDTPSMSVYDLPMGLQDIISEVTNDKHTKNGGTKKA